MGAPTRLDAEHPPQSNSFQQSLYQSSQPHGYTNPFVQAAPVESHGELPCSPYSGFSSYQSTRVPLDFGPQSFGATPLAGTSQSVSQQSGHYEDVRGASSYHDHMANAVEIAQRLVFSLEDIMRTRASGGS